MIEQLKTFHMGTKILTRCGAIEDLGSVANEAGAGRCLIVADPALISLGVLDTARNSLTSAGLATQEFTDIEPEPYLDGADAAAQMGREFGADLVIGLGGGSAMDTAKAVAVLLTNDGRAEDYVGLDKVPSAGVPTLMVPTTSGTGAEVTFTAVFTNRQTKSKGGINSVHLFPQFAVLDPVLTVSLPPAVTAYTGMDALTHAIEAMTGRASTVFTEAFALSAVRLIAQNLRRAVFHGSDLQARENMLLGSLLGGLALADAGVGAAHALAYPLGGNYRIPHGLANAILIPHVMEFNAPAAPRRFALIAKSMGETVDDLPERLAAQAAVESVSTLCWDIGIPTSLADLDIPPSDIPELVQGALTVARPVENNPRYLGEDEAQVVYENAFA